MKIVAASTRGAAASSSAMPHGQQNNSRRPSNSSNIGGGTIPSPHAAVPGVNATNSNVVPGHSIESTIPLGSYGTKNEELHAKAQATARSPRHSIALSDDGIGHNVAVSGLLGGLLDGPVVNGMNGKTSASGPGGLTHSSPRGSPRGSFSGPTTGPISSSPKNNHNHGLHGAPIRLSDLQRDIHRPAAEGITGDIGLDKLRGYDPNSNAYKTGKAQLLAEHLNPNHGAGHVHHDHEWHMKHVAETYGGAHHHVHHQNSGPDHYQHLNLPTYIPPPKDKGPPNVVMENLESREQIQVPRS